MKGILLVSALIAGTVTSNPFHPFEVDRLLQQGNTTNNDTQIITNSSKTLTFNLDQDYTVLFTLGTPPKSIRLMPAFHTHRTFITASDCMRCKTKAFNPKESSTDVPGTAGPLTHLEYIFDHYGEERGGFLVTGLAVKD